MSVRNFVLLFNNGSALLITSEQPFFCFDIYLFIYFYRNCVSKETEPLEQCSIPSPSMQQCLSSTQHSGSRNVGVPIGVKCLLLSWVCFFFVFFCFVVELAAGSRHTCPYLPLPECLTRRLWENLREPKCFTAHPPLLLWTA